MPYTLLAPALYNQATPGPTLTASSALTDISTNPQYVLPPNTVTTVGQTLHLVAGGIYTDVTTTPTLILGFYKNTQTTGGGTGVGGAALGATAAVTLGANPQATGLAWFIELYCTFGAVGTSGTVLSTGVSSLQLTASTSTTPAVIPTTTPGTAVTFDTTKPTILSVGGKLSDTNAHTVICNVFNIQLLN